jgi:DNA-directed RNA polymerase specialized sigma24 family protein
MTLDADASAVALIEQLGVGGATPSRAAAAGEWKSALEQALASMPADYAAVIRKYDLEGLAIGDVAVALGRTPGAVHMLRARGHDCLRELLGPGSKFFTHFA